MSGEAHTAGSAFFSEKKQQSGICDLPQFGKGLCHVVFYCPFADIQPLGDFFIAQAIFPAHNKDVPALRRHLLDSNVKEQR